MGKTIRISEVFFMFLLSSSLVNHIIVMPIMIETAGRNAWISTILGFLLSIPFLYLLAKVITHFKSISIFKWLEKHYQPSVRNLIGFLFFLFLFFNGWVTIKQMVAWTQDTYLFYTPILVVGIAIMIVSLYIANDVSVITICSGVIFPLVLFFGAFLVVATIPANNYSLILPILVEHGWFDIFKASFFMLSTTCELFMLIFIQHRIKTLLTFKHLLFISVVLFLFTIVPLVDIISIFGPEEAGLIKFPAFIQWRVLTIGEYFNHLDAISIYQWLSGTFIRLAFILYLIKTAFRLKRPIVIQIIVSLLYLLMNMIKISDETFMEIVERYIYPGSFMLMVVIMFLLLLFIKNVKSRVSVK